MEDEEEGEAHAGGGWRTAGGWRRGRGGLREGGGKGGERGRRGYVREGEIRWRGRQKGYVIAKGGEGGAASGEGGGG